MSVNPYQHIDCRADRGVLQVRFLDTQIQGDDTVEAIRQELLDAAERFALKKWILDLSQVNFFSSNGLRPLLGLHRKLQETGRHMIFCNLKRELLEMFQVTRLAGSGRAGGNPFEVVADLNQAMARMLHHTSRADGDILVFTFTDENLRGDNLAEDLYTEMQTALAESRARDLVLDFHKVKLITTPGIRPLLQIRGYLKDKGGRVALAGLSEMVAEVFSVTRLIAANDAAAGVFLSYPNADAAVQALRQSR